MSHCPHVSFPVYSDEPTNYYFHIFNFISSIFLFTWVRKWRELAWSSFNWKLCIFFRETKIFILITRSTTPERIEGPASKEISHRKEAKKVIDVCSDSSSSVRIGFVYPWERWGTTREKNTRSDGKNITYASTLSMHQCYAPTDACVRYCRPRVSLAIFVYSFIARWT